MHAGQLLHYSHKIHTTQVNICKITDDCNKCGLTFGSDDLMWKIIKNPHDPWLSIRVAEMDEHPLAF